jgi:hypothetical protein
MPVRCADDEEFIWAVESKAWEELRPLHDDAGDVYLSHVLGSLWYER